MAASRNCHVTGQPRYPPRQVKIMGLQQRLGLNDGDDATLVVACRFDALYPVGSTLKNCVVCGFLVWVRGKSFDLIRNGAFLVCTECAKEVDESDEMKLHPDTEKAIEEGRIPPALLDWLD